MDEPSSVSRCGRHRASADDDVRPTWRGCPHTRAAAGRGNHKLGLTRHVYVSRSQKDAEERGWFGFKGWYGSHSTMWKRFDSSRGDGDVSHYVRWRTMTFGTPEFVRNELLNQLSIAPRINYLVPRFSFGDLSHEECMQSYALFRDEVMPALLDLKIAA